MRKQKLIYILFTLSLIGVMGFSYLSEKSPVLECHWWGFSDNSPKYYTHPEKVVVEPWRGQHHVYGIFMIKGGYLNDKQFTLTVGGDQTFCGVLAFGGTTELEGVRAKPGYYLMKALLNTRIALWLISQGKGSELKQLTNWKVGYSKIR
ncbi:MAG: hypothetical protein IGS39_09005 [Calothrix sp. C42_A2020_038]|nr:hypothetical protein [Calothrix sp. C42_A2020_038]